MHAGVHGDASLFSAAQSAAPVAATSAEPQLTLRGAGGPRRWGPAHFEAAPAAAPAAAAPPRAAVTGWSLLTNHKVYCLALQSFTHNQMPGRV